MHVIFMKEIVQNTKGHLIMKYNKNCFLLIFWLWVPFLSECVERNMYIYIYRFKLISEDDKEIKTKKLTIICIDATSKVYSLNSRGRRAISLKEIFDISTPLFNNDMYLRECKKKDAYVN